MTIEGIQLADCYKIPTHGCIPCSDAHCLYQQLGIENMLAIFTGLSCGTDLPANAGMFATGESATSEQLVIDNEIFRIARRCLTGVSVEKESLAVDTIKNIRPMGNFLADDSTLRYLRSDEWSESDLLTRDKYENWGKKGSKTIVENAAGVVERLKKKSDVCLSEDRRLRIEEIVDNSKKQYRS